MEIYQHIIGNTPTLCCRQCGRSVVSCRTRTINSRPMTFTMLLIVDSRRCSHDSFPTCPTLNAAASKNGLCCKQHTSNGMADVFNQTSSRHSCTRQSRFNIAGTKNMVYCKEHAHDGMVIIVTRRGSHEPCPTFRTLVAVGSITPLHCKQLA